MARPKPSPYETGNSKIHIGDAAETSRFVPVRRRLLRSDALRMTEVRRYDVVIGGLTLRREQAEEDVNFDTVG
jgi:hypothetical protein